MGKKVTLIVLGSLLLLCGLAATAPGAFLVGVIGGDDTVNSGEHQVSTPTAALVVGTTRVAESGGITTRGLGGTTLIIEAQSDQELFIGVGRAADVDDYLNGVAFDEVRDFDLSPFRITTARHDGRTTAPAPAGEGFWLASATGTNPTLEWQVPDESNFSVVLLNADGSPDVTADASFGVRLDGLSNLGRCILVGGILAALGGLALLIWGIRTRRQPPAPPATGPPPAGPPAPAGPPPPAMPPPANPEQPPPGTHY